jgi:hypothetical protein
MGTYSTEDYLFDKLAGKLEKKILGTNFMGIQMRFPYTNQPKEYLNLDDETFEEWKKRKMRE